MNAPRKAVRPGRWPAALLVTTTILATAGVVIQAEGMAENSSQAAVEALCLRYCRSVPDVRDITVDELLRQNLQDVVLVDVRSPAERKVSSIPGSVSVTEFEQHPERFVNKVIIPFCTVGYRSGLYAQELMQKGRATRNLRGGILAWCHAAQPVYAAGKPTRRVHVYGRKWNLLPASCEGVW